MLISITSEIKQNSVLNQVSIFSNNKINTYYSQDFIPLRRLIKWICCAYWPRCSCHMNEQHISIVVEKVEPSPECDIRQNFQLGLNHGRLLQLAHDIYDEHVTNPRLNFYELERSKWLGVLGYNTTDPETLINKARELYPGLPDESYVNNYITILMVHYNQKVSTQGDDPDRRSELRRH